MERGKCRAGRNATAAALLLLAVLGLACGATPTGRDASPIDTSSDPVQVSLDPPPPATLRRGGVDYVLTPKAHYVLGGIVLGTSSYHFDDKHALAPCDVAMCWGPLAKGRQYSQLHWSQSMRWYWWTYDDSFGHDNGWVARWSSNTHIIPADANLERAAKHLRVGRPAELEGDLVSVEWQAGEARRWWNTSLGRTDQGDGSCEILYLTKVRQEGMVYE